MTYRQLAGSCDNGPCPTFHVDDETGDVDVQGYVMTARTPIPPGEDVVHIPADAWARLMADLPIRMLLIAVARKARLVRTPRVTADPVRTAVQVR